MSLKIDVAGDVVHRLLRPEGFPGFTDHHRQLELIVEFAGQVRRVDDRFVWADDRVDVLKEDDPGRDGVRPADVP